MKSHQVISFDDFRLDMVNETLWRGSKKIHLRPKTLALFQYLVERSDLLVTNKELMDALWPDINVCEYVLKNCVVEIRKALGDEAKKPRFIETVHRRGYRFIGKIGDRKTVNRRQWTGLKEQELDTTISDSQPVGRASELALLQGWLEKALVGERQVVFVTGEQGIGKTTLVDTFLDISGLGLPSESQLSNRETGAPKFRACLARGQCIESLGPSEAYMPILEAFTRLCHEPLGTRVMAALSQHAPLWLTQMPSLVSAAKLKSLQRVTLGATPARMLREMAEAIETLSLDLPLVLVLEGLHWSDYSTLDLISYLAQRRAPARLLLVATFRPEEVIGNSHPLMRIKQELQMYRQCHEILMVPLDKTAVMEYLMRRFPGHKLPVEVGSWIHQRTDGNPLFMVNLVDHLVTKGLITQQDGRCVLSAPLEEVEPTIPTTIQQMIKRRIERCSHEEQRLLEAGSVEGMEFCASTMAAALDEEDSQVEELCEGLVQRHRFLQSEGNQQLSDGKLTSRYRFTHALYQDVCYKGLPEMRQVQLHRRVGEYIEGAYVNYLGNLASKLAAHFERGREYGRAIKYYRQAADNANRRYVYCEAIELARKGLQLLDTTPDSAERTHHELNLQIALGAALMATQGFGGVEVKQAFTRAHELCGQVGDTTLLFSSLLGLWRGCRIRAEYEMARALAEQLLQLEQSEQYSMLQGQAHYALGATLIDLGEFAPALECLQQGIASRRLQEQDMNLLPYLNDPGLACKCYGAMAKWILGFPDQALRDINEALALANDACHCDDFVFARQFAAVVHQLRRESKQALELAEEAFAQARQHGLAQRIALIASIRGWALAKQGMVREGIEQMRQALDAHSAIGSIKSHAPLSLSLLAELLGDAGKIKEGLTAIEEALLSAQSAGMRHYEAEWYRIKAELMLRESEIKSQPQDHNKSQSYDGNPRWEEAERCFCKAIEVASQQRAKSFELRATTSLARLWQKQNRQAEARQRLIEIYSWFSEGHNTADLQEAHALLQQLS